MQERKSPTKGASTGGCGLNSTDQSRSTQRENAGGQGLRFSPTSTVAEAQRQRLMDALRTGPKNSYELRRLGHDIATERIALTDEDGYLHPRCALYRLQAAAQDVC